MGIFLIVDDNVAFAENLAEIVSDVGHEAVVADSGQRALELVKLRRFDGLVSDMRMPKMNGVEVVRRLREIDAGLPAIIVSAYAGDREIAGVRQQGVLGVLSKPPSMPRLLELLRVARRGGLVAIVEDDSQLADSLAEVLRRHGFASVVVGRVEELPRLSGLALCAAIVNLRVLGGSDGAARDRFERQFPSVPLLVVSGHADLGAELATAVRFDEPLVTRELVERLVRLYDVGSHH